MKHYKTVAMLASSLLAIAMLSGCGQNGDMEKMDSDATMMKDTTDNMSEKVTTMGEDAMDTGSTMVEDAADSIGNKMKSTKDDVQDMMGE